jgi:predicted RNA-binding Zn ribbon-like protein
MHRPKGRILRCAPAELCLEFVNTVAWRKTESPEERLPSPSALLDWCVDAGSPATGDVAGLRRLWHARPREARLVYRKAVELREAIYRIFRSRIRGEPLPERELRVFNEILGAVPSRVRVAPTGGGVGWWSRGTARPLDMLAPIAWSAAELMTSPRAERVRQCADETGCGYLFLDESRAGTRRWCSMGECGNRAKARRHYHRQKESGAPTRAGANQR